MSSALPFAASPAAEFPCDNPLLHEGVGWMCLSLGGPPRAIARARLPAARAVWPEAAALPAPAEPAVAAPAEPDPDETARAEPAVAAPAEPAVAAPAEADPDETAPAESWPEPPLSVALPLILARVEALAALEAAALEAAALEAAPEPAAAEGGFVIHSLELLEEGAPAAAEVAAPAEADPWCDLVGAVVAVAMAQGASRAAAVARALLEGDAHPEGLGAELTTALGRAGILEGSGAPAAAFLAAREAWRAVLRGLTDDFGAAAATTLDAWCEALLRALGVGAETKVDLRKALRREGVAAFGLRRAA